MCRSFYHKLIANLFCLFQKSKIYELKFYLFENFISLPFISAKFFSSVVLEMQQNIHGLNILMDKVEFLQLQKGLNPLPSQFFYQMVRKITFFISEKVNQTLKISAICVLEYNPKIILGFNILYHIHEKLSFSPITIFLKKFVH